MMITEDEELTTTSSGIAICSGGLICAFAHTTPPSSYIFASSVIRPSANTSTMSEAVNQKAIL
ncbi:hypothetical protein LINPERHAP1_LOCUS32337 [Linum perenne]